MRYEALGLADAPTLVCIPGLFGGLEDFREMAPTLAARFRILIMTEVSEPFDVARAIRESGSQGAYLLGVSFGAQIAYDFATRFTELFLGAVLTDCDFSDLADLAPVDAELAREGRYVHVFQVRPPAGVSELRSARFHPVSPAGQLMRANHRRLIASFVAEMIDEEAVLRSPPAHAYSEMGYL